MGGAFDVTKLYFYLNAFSPSIVMLALKFFEPKGSSVGIIIMTFGLPMGLALVNLWPLFVGKDIPLTGRVLCMWLGLLLPIGIGILISILIDGNLSRLDPKTLDVIGILIKCYTYFSVGFWIIAQFLRMVLRLSEKS